MCRSVFPRRSVCEGRNGPRSEDREFAEKLFQTVCRDGHVMPRQSGDGEHPLGEFCPSLRGDPRIAERFVDVLQPRGEGRVTRRAGPKRHVRWHSPIVPFSPAQDELIMYRH